MDKRYIFLIGKFKICIKDDWKGYENDNMWWKFGVWLCYFMYIFLENILEYSLEVGFLYIIYCYLIGNYLFIFIKL